MAEARPAPPEHDDDGISGIATGRSYDRFVNFSDAVVAIAITLLGLPLVDIAPPANGENAWDVIGDNSGQLSAFAFTFLVVAMLWAAHHRVFGRIRGFDPPLLWINLGFLFAIVLLPFPSEWVGEQGFEYGVGTFYLGTLAAASGFLGLVGWYARRHPAMLEPAARHDVAQAFSMNRSVLFTLFFALMAVLALPWPAQTSYLMFLLFPMSFLQRRLERAALAAQAAPAAPGGPSRD